MSEHDSLLRAIFMEALEIGEPQQRAAFLSRACGADLELRKKVEELLKSEAAACNFLPGQPAASASRAALLQVAEALDPDRSPSVPLAEKPGDRIGRYRLLQKIGEGGCGVVYMAEKEEPVRRKVALKVIKLGMDTRSVMARFDAERQALALMDHPNIARVLDPGATDTGRPFFVMELVRGIKVTDYCDQNNLTTLERLELFIQVCQAIQHAHQKGIIHRDIKPSNVLVTLHERIIRQTRGLGAGTGALHFDVRATTPAAWLRGSFLLSLAHVSRQDGLRRPANGGREILLTDFIRRRAHGVQ